MFKWLRGFDLHICVNICYVSCCNSSKNFNVQYYHSLYESSECSVLAFCCKIWCTCLLRTQNVVHCRGCQRQLININGVAVCLITLGAVTAEVVMLWFMYLDKCYSYVTIRRGTAGWFEIEAWDTQHKQMLPPTYIHWALLWAKCICECLVNKWMI